MPHSKMTLVDNIAFKTLDKILTAVVSVFSLVAVVILPIDAYSFLTEPDQYIMVHDLDTTKRLWQFQYLNGTITFFVIGLAALFFIFYSLRNKDNKRLQIVRQIVIFCLALIILSGYYHWYQTGFDH